VAHDQKLIGILSGTATDCGPQPGRTSPAFGCSVIAVKPRGKVGGQQVALGPVFLQNYVEMYIKTSFFDVMSEVPKDSEDVSAGIGCFF
jgi:hypothetical protein